MESLVRAVFKAPDVRTPSGLASAGADPADAREAFAAQLTAFRRELYARAVFLAQDRVAADDLVQEVYERALVCQHQFRLGTNLRAWLNSILRSIFIDGRRREARRLRVDSHTDSFAGDGDHLGPLDILTIDDVTTMLDRLNASDREIFTLAHIEHISYREISSRLGMPTKTVGTRLWRVRAKIRRTLELVCEDRLADLHESSC